MSGPGDLDEIAAHGRAVDTQPSAESVGIAGSGRQRFAGESKWSDRQAGHAGAVFVLREDPHEGRIASSGRDLRSHRTVRCDQIRAEFAKPPAGTEWKRMMSEVISIQSVRRVEECVQIPFRNECVEAPGGQRVWISPGCTPRLAKNGPVSEALRTDFGRAEEA